jgi:hypothetical protein
MARMSEWLVLGGIVLGAGCGADARSDADDGAGRLPDGTRTGAVAESQPPSGVDATRAVHELRAQEAERFCTWSLELELAVDAATVQEQCVYYAASDDVAACEQGRDRCVSDYQAHVAARDPARLADEAALCVAFLALGAEQGCAATIAELEACVREDAAAVESALSGLSCDNVLDSALLDGAPAEDAAACVALADACPGWFVPTSDEQDAWECADGATIPARWVCDGTPDCYDGEDENACHESEASAASGSYTSLRRGSRLSLPRRP